MSYDCMIYLVHEKSKHGMFWTWADDIAEDLIKFPSECITLFSSWLGPQAMPPLFDEAKSNLWAEIENSYFGG